MKQLAVAFMLTLCACGRFGFEQGSSGDDDGGTDADASVMDANPSVDAGNAADAALWDARPCLPECTGGCIGDLCVIDGTTQGGVIRCPDDRPCRVECLLADECPSNVDCSGASSCEVVCAGDRSCFFGVECNAGPCQVTCGGAMSCGTISCNSASSCSVTCSGTQSCPFQTACTTDCSVTCTGVDACTGGVDCSSACACDVTCDPDARCPGSPGFVSCPGGCDDADGCTRQPVGCDTCP